MELLLSDGTYNKYRTVWSYFFVKPKAMKWIWSGVGWLERVDKSVYKVWSIRVAISAPLLYTVVSHMY